MILQRIRIAMSLMMGNNETLCTSLTIRRDVTRMGNFFSHKTKFPSSKFQKARLVSNVVILEFHKMTDRCQSNVTTQNIEKVKQLNLFIWTGNIQ